MMKYFKVLFKLLLAAFLLILIGWIALLGSLQTKTGQEWVVAKLLNYIENEVQAQVEVSKVEFVFPLHLRLHSLRVKRDLDLTFSIERLDLSVSPLQLLEGQIVCTFIHAKGVNVANLSSFLDQTASKSSSPTFYWDRPILPFYLKVNDFLIEDLHLDSNDLNRFAVNPFLSNFLKSCLYRIQGNFNNYLFRSDISAHFLLTATDQTKQFPPLSFTLDAQNNYLSVSLHCNRVPLNAFTDELPSTYANIAYHASASLASWKSFIREQPDSEAAIEGNFKLQLENSHAENLPTLLIGELTSLKGKYLATSKRELCFSDIKLNSPCCHLRGEMTLTADLTLKDTNFNGEIRHLDKVTVWSMQAAPQVIEGVIAIQGQVEGPLKNPAWSINLASPHLQINQFSFENFNSTLFSRFNGPTLTGIVNLEAIHEKIPLKLKADFKWDSNERHFALPALHLESHEAFADGHIGVSLEHLICDGQMRFGRRS